MRKLLLIFSLLAVLALPAAAAPRDDDPRGPGSVVKRVVLLIKRLVAVLDDPMGIGPPKP